MSASVSGSPQAGGRPALRGSTPSIARDAEIETIIETCTRFLPGHGYRPTSELLATIAADTKVDYYGLGGVVHDLEAEVAALLGKQAALFVPSGTMAQQATLRVHGDRRGRHTVTRGLLNKAFPVEQDRRSIGSGSSGVSPHRRAGVEGVNRPRW